MVLIVVLYKIDSLLKTIIKKIRKTMGEAKQMSQKTKRILIPILASLVVAAGGVAITAQFPEITGTVAEAASVSAEDSDDGISGEGYSFDSTTKVLKISTNDGVSNYRNDSNIDKANIESVELTEDVTRLNKGAFQGCSSLKRLIVPGFIKWGDRLFDDPSMVTVFTRYRRYWWYSYEKNRCAYINYGIKSDGTISIQNCDNIKGINGTTIEIPEKIDGKQVTVINKNAFYEFGSLQSIILPEGLRKIDYSAFYNCYSLQSVTLPEGLQRIGGYAFYHTSLNSITLPEGLQTIGSGAFSECGSLQSITLPKGLQKIEGAAFWGCFSLKSITLPEGLQKIGGGAFRECPNLESIVLPEGLYSVGYDLFLDCPSLKELTLPSTITKTRWDSFRSCETLEKVTFTSPNPNATPYSKANWRNLLRNLRKDAVFTNGCLRYREDMTDGTPSITIIDYIGSDKTVTIPESIDGKPVTRIMSYGFHGNEYVENIIVPDSVTEIQGDAFKNCAKLKTVKLPKNLKGLYHCTFKNCPSLTDVTIPEGVTFIGTNAFQDCTALQKIEIPASVKKLKDGAFQGCTSLSEVTLHNGLLYLSFDAFNGCTDLQQITLPNSLKMIKSRAFKNSGLQTITLPNSVTTMGEEVFMGCTGLTEASLSNKLSYTNYYTFSGCTNLEKVTLPAGIKTIGYGTFSACSSLKTIALPSTLEGIDEGAFNDCTSLQAITIPDSVKYIGGRAFQNCVGLQKATLSQSLIAIPWSAFENCVNLQSVNIPKKVTTINAEAFKNCTSLQSVTIPDRVNTIYQEAFSGCRSLSTVTVPKYVTSIGENIFANCPNTTIKGYKNSYASAYFEGDSRFVLLDDGSGGNTGGGGAAGGGGAIGGAGGAGAVTPPKEDTTISVKNCTVSTIGDQILVAGSVEPEVTVSDGNKLLEDGVDYMVYYRKNNKIGEANAVIVGLGNYSGTKTVKFTVLPNNIDWKKCSTSTSAVRLNWEKVFGAEGYKIYRWNTGTNQWDSIADVKKLTSYRDGSRTVGCTYQYAVTAYATANGKTYESTLQTITTATRPKQAAIRKITANSKKKVTLTWKKIDGATGYQIYRSTEKNGTYTRVKTLSENTLKYTDKNLKSGKTYYYKIRAYRTVEDTRFYGAFSTARAITVK